MAILLVKVDENSPGKRIEIAHDEVLIGRIPRECTVVLDDRGVSRKHAVIRRVGREYFLVDLGSRNKTFLNSRAIPPNQPQLLHDGDHIRVSTVAMVFYQTMRSADSFEDEGSSGNFAGGEKGTGEYMRPEQGSGKYARGEKGSGEFARDEQGSGKYARGEKGSGEYANTRGAKSRKPYIPTNAERLYPLWFGTNRRPVDATDPASGFTSEDEQVLSYGRCSVMVPISHKIGSTGSSAWRRWLSGHDDRLKLVRLERLAEEAFWASVRTALENHEVGSRDAVVFIHGFNVSFEEAALRAAQIGFDLNVRGIMAFYSWPSKGSSLPLHYTADEATIEASEPFLAEFLIRLAKDSGAERVHVIAHSMGNRGLLRSMHRIATRTSLQDAPPFGHLVLAAPDIDSRVFRDLARVYEQVAARTTLYASSKDRALASSGIVHDHPRAGYTPPLTVIPSIDTIEVSNVDLTILGHGYFAEARALLYDLHDLLINDLPPDRRMGLRATVATAGERFWVIAR